MLQVDEKAVSTISITTLEVHNSGLLVVRGQQFRLEFESGCNVVRIEIEPIIPEMNATTDFADDRNIVFQIGALEVEQRVVLRAFTTETSGLPNVVSSNPSLDDVRVLTRASAQKQTDEVQAQEFVSYFFMFLVISEMPFGGLFFAPFGLLLQLTLQVSLVLPLAKRLQAVLRLIVRQARS